MDKSLELFAQNGFESTSVQQITDYCGISKGAFYLSFKSKDELIIALIDHFMSQLTEEIDYMVRETESAQLLYKFYQSIFSGFKAHSSFAKLLMKEQTQSLNKELIAKFRYYEQLIDQIILSMVERLYGEEIEETKYDLVYSIKGLMNSYSSLFIFYNISLDVEILCESLVEKTNLLAKYTTLPIITKEFANVFKEATQQDITSDKIAQLIDQSIVEVNDPLEKESLTILKQQLLIPNYSPAIVSGMLENIRNHPQCKWIAFLLREFYNL